MPMSLPSSFLPHLRTYTSALLFLLSIYTEIITSAILIALIVLTTIIIVVR